MITYMFGKEMDIVTTECISFLICWLFFLYRCRNPKRLRPPNRSGLLIKHNLKAKPHKNSAFGAHLSSLICTA